MYDDKKIDSRFRKGSICYTVQQSVNNVQNILSFDKKGRSMI
ncbi:hypothetical protein B4065_0445 [Caldibacillus thermoamylovorans]|nr:hypothetical protein B4065_0445 [Caldibacillus thermoamylovorans]KIO70407.1 hypothetical protein B4166_0570 [Caldibacillus thermoamylovorans]